jgi:UDP-glucose 4-epimerase
MIAAMRRGLGRSPKLFALPPVALELSLRAVGKQDLYRRLSGSLVADPSALIGLGWAPRLTTLDGLGQLMREN